MSKIATAVNQDSGSTRKRDPESLEFRVKRPKGDVRRKQRLRRESRPRLREQLISPFLLWIAIVAGYPAATKQDCQEMTTSQEWGW